MAVAREVVERRKAKVRRKIKSVAGDRFRLSVSRSSKNIYAQVIDDTRHHTVASASTLDTELKKSLKTGADCEAARAVGQMIGQRAVKNGVKRVVFDRGPLVYHGRVRALAESAREAGLEF